MKYGLAWHVGVGEHDYEEISRQEFGTVADLLTCLAHRGSLAYGADALFDALEDGRQDTIHWVTDDFGFAFYRP